VVPAAAQAGAGAREQARQSLAELRAIVPGLDAASLPGHYQRQRLADLPGLLEHLVAAGLPPVHTAAPQDDW